MDRETAFGIVNEAEVLCSLFDRNYIHKSGGVGDISADFSIDFDKALHNNRICFAGVESIL